MKTECKNNINCWLQLKYTKSKLVSFEVFCGYCGSGWSYRLVRLHEKGYAVRFIFGFILTFIIRGVWRMEISRRRLREKSDKISRTYSSWPTASEWTDTTNKTPPTPNPTAGKADDNSHRDYNLPIPSRKASRQLWMWRRRRKRI